MKLYKDYTKEPFSLLVNDTNLPSDNSRTCTKITFSQKIKTIDNKIEQNKAQYNLRRQMLIIWLYHQEMLVNMNF